ncbi:RHS repeat-associated core domain-containing protein [Pseudomonas salmasensis]|uniref:RHS repeat-associated core domain-containing protein n=1 Tax=Pseudomonas salmasensis TaxID=2745514 RepID=A0ABU5FHY3_9PSED|nr:RHS repeat-associated core domain-containing protein [Pseudomonas salmasensis]MDY4300940.1 RHS repeat-associated core domain-containing protein [Pseudomonas salmasensis]
MTQAAHITFIEHELDGFHQSLVEYRQQMGAWYSRALDTVSHAADMPSLLGMDRVLRAGDAQQSVSLGDTDFSTVARCPAGGVLKIQSRFESAYDVPIGNIPVEVIGLDDGSSRVILLDEHGEGSHDCAAGGRYQVRVQGGVSAQQVDALFASYAGLTADLEQWLREQWQGFKPHWQQSTASAIGSGVLAGSWAAIRDAWDSIKQVQAMLEDPLKYAEQLGSEAARLAQIATDAPKVMEQAMLLASDEAALYLILRTAMIWLEALPPSEVAQAAAGFMVSLLIDLVIGAVLTIALPAAGVAYLSMRLVKYGARVLQSAVGFVTGVLTILTKFMRAVDRYKAVAVRGVVGGLKQGTMQMRWRARQNAVLTQKERVDDVPAVASNPKGDAAAPAGKTVTHGCPVSMVTGEELLTLTDGVLDGILPFEWTRLYRTSAVEVDCGLGFGWSHALAHRLVVSGDLVVWTDHENRSTTLPLPTDSRPAITNSLAEAAIYLGSAPDELVLAQASRFYHFRDGVLTTISDAYDNRLRLCRDLSGRIERLDNGAGRSLLLRYELDRIVAVDYQVHRAKGREPYVWETEQNVVSYAYDEAGRLVCATNAVGESERYRYDDQHVILERQLAGGASFFWEWEHAGKAARCVRHWASFSQMDTRYAWGDDGHVTVHNADGSQEVYVHDQRARLVQRIDPDGATHFKSYDDQGRLTVEQDPMGAVTAYQYDDAGRLVALFPGDDEPTAYEHDNGFVRVVRRGEAVWKYERNDQGDVIRKTDPDGNSTDYSYNKQGKLTGIWYPDSSCHRLVWNERGQLLEEQLPNGGIKRYRYDDLGRQVAREDEHGAQTVYEWDSVGRLIRLVLPGGATREFSYNPYGKIIAERDELGHVTRYEYADGLHLISRRLNADGTQVKYRYDNVRLLLTEIENETGETYQLDYHPNGLIRQETGFDGQRTAYAYDLNGNLLEKTEYGDDGSQLITRYQRDCAGRLVRKTLPDNNIIDYAERHRSYLFEPDSFRPLALLEGFGPQATTPYHYQLDHLGTPQELTSPEGEIVWSAHYRAYGQIARLDVGKIDNPLRFQGQYFDAESGLHYNLHRYYNPDIGRYLTPDPVKLAGGINGYRYVPNPTGWVDPLGLNSCPGSDGCKPSTSAQNPAASVNHGEPALPQLTRAQRQARIDELAESNAHRRLSELEASIPGAHFLEKHGAQTSLESQLERVMTARNPTTGEIETFGRGRRAGQPRPPSAATHFLSHRDQLKAIDRAILIFKLNGRAAVPASMDMGKVIGEGYKRDGLEYGKQRKAFVHLNEDGKPITAYTDF